MPGLLELDTNIKKAAATVIALGVLGGVATGAWSFGTMTGVRPALLMELNTQIRRVQTQAEQNTQSLIYLEYWRLDDLKKLGILDFEKFQRYCELAALNKYYQNRDCLFNVPMGNGEVASAIPRIGPVR